MGIIREEAVAMQGTKATQMNTGMFASTILWGLLQSKPIAFKGLVLVKRCLGKHCTCLPTHPYNPQSIPIFLLSKVAVQEAKCCNPSLPPKASPAQFLAYIVASALKNHVKDFLHFTGTHSQSWAPQTVLFLQATSFRSQNVHEHSILTRQVSQQVGARGFIAAAITTFSEPLSTEFP